MEKVLYKAREYFKPYHNRTKRYSIMVCHRRAGKTVASIVDIIDKAYKCQKYNPRFAYIAPFRSQAENIAWNYLIDYTAGIRKSSNKSDLIVVLKGNNATIRLFGADNQNALRGMYLDGCVLDEYADFRDNVWGEVIRPMLSDRKGWAAFIGTPRGHNAFYKLWDKAKKHQDEWYSSILAYWDTGILDDEEIGELKRTMSESQFRQEMCCDWEAAVEGTYYGKDMELALTQGRIGHFPHNPQHYTFTAWDLGFTDSTAIWFFQVIDSKVYLIDFYQNASVGIDHYINVVVSKPYQYAMHYLPHDALQRRIENGERSILMQMQEKVHYNKLHVLVQQNILDGIAAARITLGVCYFHEATCIEGIECLRLYKRKWNALLGNLTDNPVRDEYCHGADAFRYLALGWEDINRRFEPEKTVKQQIADENHVTIDILKARRELEMGETSRW